jgi:hypothetical protein
MGGCDPTLDDAVQAASACSESGIPIYVLGVGPSLDNLHEIAEAGATDRAYLVEGGDVEERVLDALTTIRDNALPCEFLIPEPSGEEVVDFDFFNVVYTEASEETYNIPYVEEAGDCDDEGGWHLDDAESPTELQLCPKTCDLVSQGGGRFQFAFGCERIDRVR